MKKLTFVISSLLILLTAFSAGAEDFKLEGQFTGPYPHPYRFKILNQHELLLEWGNPFEVGHDKWYDQSRDDIYAFSKIYQYTLEADSVFLRIRLNEDLPTTFWDKKYKMPEKKRGNVLFALLGTASDTGKTLGVTYPAITDSGKGEAFTIDVPSYALEGPGNRHFPLEIKNASSELREGETKYKLWYIDSVRPELTWVEGAEGNGIGEWFELHFNDPPLHLAIINGFISVRDPSLYWKNGRVKVLKFEGLSTGKSFTRTLKDTPHLQSVDIRELGEEETAARVSIAEVYPGSLYADTCLHFMSYSRCAIEPFPGEE